VPNLDLRLTLVSPLFSYGAYQKGKNARPELRAQSIRGQLRYWLRAIIGAQTDRLNEVWDRESAVFGSAGQGSVVSVRVFAPLGRPLKTASVPMLPHRAHSGGPQSPAPAITEGQVFQLMLTARPGVPLPEDALAALRVWALLGGVGKRSRRMFGSFKLTPDDVLFGAAVGNIDAYVATTRQTLAGIKTAPKPGLPAWPTLHPDHSWVIIGREFYTSAEEANQALFHLLRGSFRNDERTFGYATQGRRASPLHAQVRKFGSQYYPVLTALRSKPDKDVKWPVLAQFMKEAESKFSGETVWGGW
jgi:CRISPR-associated protein Cmr1